LGGAGDAGRLRALHPLLPSAGLDADSEPGELSDLGLIGDESFSL
ncbi:MAG: hypothetical protein RL565_1194, partial [Pseudomonadota bacterium]